MNQASFLPEDYLEQRVQRRTNFICMTLFLITMVGVVGAFAVTDHQRRDAHAQKAEIETQFQETAARLDQLEELQRRKQRMLHKAKVTAVLLEPVPRSNILAEMINTMPAPVTISSLELETKADRSKRRQPTTSIEAAKQKAKQRGRSKLPQEPAPPQAKPTVVSIILTGSDATDVDVADYMMALGTSMLFDDVNLQFSEQLLVDGLELRKFKIALRLNQDLQLGSFTPRLAKRRPGRNPFQASSASAPTAGGLPGLLPALRGGRSGGQGD